MKFEVGKKYRKTGDGTWTCVGIHNGVPLMLHANGRDLHNIGSSTYFEQMFFEYKEPVTVEGWVNVYDPPFDPVFTERSFFTTKEAAQRSAKSITCETFKLVATVFVKGTSDET